ncbi:hypothetical protein GCM10011529_20740 [Polymorphobacter glacialis]|uniref:Ice-binding protein C-terminal domain-containing protein n=1 Tax=Sandarakinorhabdus glacialis TaxID=1614636 RepID=A0A916ZU25_9SPHN|nr:PEPxxWA-CTERM sorting domain-containing protein [Polymorphobacter glacialis]GGE14175.1 hypothetical protein GCM10011529_20740 [Polymorphobacter glacialis]
MIKRILLAAVATAAFAGNAGAATIIFNPGVFGAPAGYTLFNDFDSVESQSLVTGSGFFFPTGNVGGQAAAIPGNSTPYLAVGSGTASIDFTNDVRSFSFDYSTVDSYNTLTINYADGGFEAISGDDILSGGQANGSTSGSFIINGDGRLIAGLALTSNSPAFEVDNLAFSDTLASVPEPAAWALLTVGFGLVGATMRRRSRTTVAA